MESHDVAMERRAQESTVTDMSRTCRRVTVDRDADLAERLCRHEPGATEALVAVYGDRVYRLAIGITGNRSDAEEVVQDALWTVVRRIETFRGDAAFASWVYRISVNAAYQKRRARGSCETRCHGTTLASRSRRPARTFTRIATGRRD